MECQQQKILILIGLAALLVGGVIYLTDRPSESIYFLPVWHTSSSWQINLFGSIGNYLPTFLHTFAFILLTTVCLLPSKRMLILICTAWLVIDTLFEIAQSEPIAQWIAISLGNHFDGLPVLENLVPYFLNGVFDFSDIYSIAVGTVAAYLTVQYVAYRHKGNSHEDNTRKTNDLSP